MGLNREAKKFTDRYREIERSVDERSGAFTAIVILVVGLLGLVIGGLVGALFF